MYSNILGLELKNECVSRVERRDRNKRMMISPWMNQMIRRGIRRREQAWRRFHNLPSYILEAKYKKIRNIVTKHIRQANGKFKFKLSIYIGKKRQLKTGEFDC